MNSRTSLRMPPLTAGPELRRVRAGEPERRSLGVPADHPGLAGVDDLAAECADALHGGVEIVDGEVGEREAVAGAAPPLVQPELDPVPVALPAPALLGSAAAERDLE